MHRGQESTPVALAGGDESEVTPSTEVYRKGLCSAVTLVIQGDGKDLGQGHPRGSQAPSPLFRNTETPPLSPSKALVKWVSAQQPLLFFWKLPLTLL